MQNHNYFDKLIELYRENMLTLEFSSQIGVSEAEQDGFLAFQIRDFMEKEYVPQLGGNIFFAAPEDLYEKMRESVQDITHERFVSLLHKMQKHGLIEQRNGNIISLKMPMANMPLE